MKSESGEIDRERPRPADRFRWRAEYFGQQNPRYWLER